MRFLYFLAILPPPSASEEIHQIRLECSGKFKVYKALRPPVHITLYKPFHAEESSEEKIIDLLKAGTSELLSFTQQLENFGSFRKKVVYINALKSQELIGLQRSVNAVIVSNKLDPKPDENTNPSFNPHVTIAYRDLQANDFPAIWNEYKNREFKLSFPVNEFTLLKHQHEVWNPVFSFNLKGNARKPISRRAGK